MKKLVLMFLACTYLTLAFGQRDTGRSSSSRTSPQPSRSQGPDRQVNQNRSSTPQSVREQRNNGGAGERNNSNAQRSERSTRPIPYAAERNQQATTNNSTNAKRPARPNMAQAYELDYLRNTMEVPSDPKNKTAAAPVLRAKGGKEIIQVNWMSIEQAFEKNKVEKRKIYIDVYTDWCGWCKQMDSTTFGNATVAKYLNDNYYPVKFNAEQQQDVTLNGKTYKFVRNGARGHHELATQWLNNRLSFPTSVFLDESMNTIQPLPGYLEAQKMEAILNYFGSNSHKTTPWEAFERKFATQRK
jgi:thioredoxin-related protein